MTKYQIQQDQITKTIILVEDIQDEELNPMILDTEESDVNFWSPKVGLYIQDTEFVIEEREIDEDFFHLIAKPKK